MDIKNYFLKKKQLKAIQKNIGDINYNNFYFFKFNCPKCYWRTDELTAYTTHLENHLIKKKREIINELS